MAKEWKDSEIKLLKKRRSQGKGWLEISAELKRTADSVRMWYRNNVSNTTKEHSAPIEKLDAPKIGIFDVETLPMIVYTWGVYKPYISPDMGLISTQ